MKQKIELTNDTIAKKVIARRDYILKDIARSRRKIKAIMSGKTSFEGFAILESTRERSLIFEAMNIRDQQTILKLLDHFIFEK